MFVALAHAIGWGIRGNFGHEDGAMVPGVLPALALCIACDSRAMVQGRRRRIRSPTTLGVRRLGGTGVEAKSSASQLLCVNPLPP